jgi:hypothetical protein
MLRNELEQIKPKGGNWKMAIERVKINYKLKNKT